MGDEQHELVTLAVPCRTDEPALGRTLEEAWCSWQRVPPGTRLELLVCLNGGGASGAPPRADLAAFARARGVSLVEIDADARPPAPLPPLGSPLAVIALSTRVAGKPAAWNLLRRRARAPVAIFLDADVSIAADAIPLLLEAARHNPGAALISGRTVCAPRANGFEAIMAVPYRVGFPNLSPQLYAARLQQLPPAVPDAALDQEHWLELAVGPDAIVRVPDAVVTVRLPGTLADFFRQRVRIEMGKVQLAHEYAGMGGRTHPQPGARAALSALGAAELARLATYLALRAGARAVAWLRYRSGRTGGVWQQASSTKRWDGE